MDNHTEKEHNHNLKLKKPLQMILNILICLILQIFILRHCHLQYLKVSLRYPQLKRRSHKPSSDQYVYENYIIKLLSVLTAMQCLIQKTVYSVMKAVSVCHVKFLLSVSYMAVHEQAYNRKNLTNQTEGSVQCYDTCV